MSKECPSCHRECDEVWECRDCGKMYCLYCSPWLPLVSMVVDPTCPDCSGVWRGLGDKVSRDDETSSTFDDETMYDGETAYDGGLTIRDNSNAFEANFQEQPILSLLKVLIVICAYLMVAQTIPMVGDYLQLELPGVLHEKTLLWPLMVVLSAFPAAVQLVGAILEHTLKDLNWLEYEIAALASVGLWSSVAWLFLSGINTAARGK